MGINAKKVDFMPYFSLYNSPIGPLTLTSDGESLTGLWMESQTISLQDAAEVHDLPVFRAARDWLDAYFRGESPQITVPLSPAGTDFQRKVWAKLLEIPYGETTTYGAIAKAISPNMSAQAVGQAVGRNPISIIIPCHRVIGTNGKLTGYAGGLDKKQWLLRHEEVTK